MVCMYVHMYVCMYRKEPNMYRVPYCPWFQAPTGGVGVCPLWRRGTAVV